MSLFDGVAPLDHLLDGIVKSAVYFAIRKDWESTRGRGTYDDPYDAGYHGGECRMDTVLRDEYLVPAHSVIILGAGEFCTQGFRNNSATEGFSVRKGWRFIGEGWGNDTIIPDPPNPDIVIRGPTVVKMVDLDDPGRNIVFGCGGDPGDSCDGFELTGLQIDCGLITGYGVGTRAGAVDVNGSHIRVHDLRIVNFGTIGGTVQVVSIARPSEDQPDVRNCVAYNCVIEEPSEESTGTVICMATTMAPNQTGDWPHEGCVLRDNAIDCEGGTGEFIGVSASGGRGNIIECNRVWNVTYGFHASPDHSTKDLIFRDNVLGDVLYGFYFHQDDVLSRTLARTIIEENKIDLLTSGSPFGVKLAGEGSTSPRRFTQATIRRNQIRHVDAAAGPSGTVGIDLDSVAQAVVEENLLNIGPTPDAPAIDKAIKWSACDKVTTLNNQSTAGKFLPATYGSPMRQTPDLVTDAQDWMLGI